MPNPPPKEKRDFARQLRKESTNAERLLWSHLRDRKCLGFKFRRQQPIGPYIGDFVCYDPKLVVELDGSQHDLPEIIEYDKRRSRWLQANGFAVVRFWNAQVYVDVLKVVAQVEERLLALTLPSPGDVRGQGEGPVSQSPTPPQSLSHFGRGQGEGPVSQSPTPPQSLSHFGRGQGEGAAARQRTRFDSPAQDSVGPSAGGSGGT